MDRCRVSEEEIAYDMGSPAIIDRSEDYQEVYGRDDRPHSFAEQGYQHVVSQLLEGKSVLGRDMIVRSLEDHLLDIRRYQDLRLFCGEPLMQLYKNNELTDAQRKGFELEAKILASIVVG